MKKIFDRIEDHLCVLFEEQLPKIFYRHSTHHSLVDDLIQVMRDNTRMDTEGRLIAPDKYWVLIPYKSLDDWQAHIDILAELASTIHQTGSKEGLRFLHPIRIELQPDDMIERGKFSVSAYFSSNQTGIADTAVIVPEEQTAQQVFIPESAMLIIAGQNFFPLEKPIINIGRHSENDLILNDPQISRHHAQLRVINNHYVIFDVGSTAGLYLNGNRITQATLHAGDVIRIGTVNLIYNQEPTNTFSTSVVQTDNQTPPPGDDQA